MSRRSLARIPHAYIAQLVSVGGSAALTFLSTFMLSVPDRGRFAVFMLCATLGSYILSLGIQSELLKVSAKDGPAAAMGVASSLWRAATPVAVLGASILVLANPLPTITRPVLAAAMVGALLGAAFNWLAWVDFGHGSFARSTTMRGVFPAVSLASLFVAYFLGSDALLVWSVLGYLLALTVGVLAMLLSMPPPDLGRDVHAWGFLRPSLAYLVGQSATMGWVRFPLLMTAARADPTNAAIVGLSLSVADLQAHLPQMRAAITFREAAKTARPRWTADQVIKSLATLLPGSALAIVAACTLAAMLGDEYSDVPTTVLALLPGSAALALLASVVNILSAQGRNRSATVITGTSLLTLTIVVLLTGADGLTGIVIWSGSAIILLSACAAAANAPRWRRDG